MSYGRRPVNTPPPNSGHGGTGSQPAASLNPQQMQFETYRLARAIWEKMKNLEVRLARIEKFLDVAPSQFGKKVNIDGKGVDLLGPGG